MLDDVRDLLIAAITAIDTYFELTEDAEVQSSEAEISQSHSQNSSSKGDPNN